MESSDFHGRIHPDDDAGEVRTVENSLRTGPTMEERALVEGEEEMVAEDTQGDHSTMFTEWSHNKRGSSTHPSSLLESETDPTSIPSGMLDDLELDRKCTESPAQTDEVMYGSDPALRQYTESPLHTIDSVHSGQSDSSTGHRDSKEGPPVTVNPGKVKAIGGHFGESSTETSAPRFHDPRNNWEAEHIKNKIQQVHATMDDIELHPEKHFQDHGSSFQVSARPKASPNPILDVDSDIAHKRKVHLAPESLMYFDMEEGYNTERLGRRCSSCCIVM